VCSSDLIALPSMATPKATGAESSPAATPPPNVPTNPNRGRVRPPPGMQAPRQRIE
jgi:hypothetical protein